MASERDDFAYVASLDLSEVNASLGAIEQRMARFTSDVLSQLTIIEAGFNKAFATKDIKLEAPRVEVATDTGSAGTGQTATPDVSGYRAAQQEVKNLISAQLELISVNDGTAISLIKNANAASGSVSEFKKLVTQLTTVTSKEFELAKSISETQARINTLNTQFEAGKISASQYEAALEPLEQTLEDLGSLQGSRETKQIIQEQNELNAAYTRLGDGIAKVAQIQQTKGNAAFQKALRQFPQIRTEVQKLVGQYGPFEAKINSTGQATSKQESQFQRLIRTDRTLAAEVDRLTKEYGQFTVALNTSTVGAEKQGLSLKALATRVAITGGIVSRLTNEVLNLGRRGAQAFQDLISSSVQLNQQFDAAKISFAAIFDGNKEVAAGVFDFVREESRRLGIDLAQISTTFLPQVDNLDQLTKLAELSTELLRLPAAIAGGKTQQDAILALSELFAGQTRTLQTRFNITLEDTQKIKNALDEQGIAGAIETLDQVLTDLGINFDDFTNETPFLLNKVRQSAIDLQDTLGEPIDRELNEFAQFLVAFLEENQDKIDEFAGAIGELVASVGGTIGDGLIQFLENIDFDEAIENIKDFQESMENAIEVISDLKNGILALDEQFANADLQPGEGEFSFVDLEEGLQEKLGFNLKALANPIESIKVLLNLLGDLVEFVGNIEIDWDKFFNPVPFKAFSESVDNIVTSSENAATAIENLVGEIFDGTEDLKNAPKEFLNVLKDFGVDTLEGFGITYEATMEDAVEATEEVTKSVNDLADSIIAADRIAELEIELTTATEETQTVIDEINDEILKANREVNAKVLDAQKDLERERFDFLIKASRKRIDIEQDYLDELEDIDTKAAQKRDDIFLEFTRDEEDINRDAARERNEVERDLAKERLKIEEDLLRELARIRRQFDFDAQEAIRQNDAIAFLQLKRKLAFDLNEAKIKRDEDVADAEASAEEERDKVNQKLDEQLEDARIKRDRAVEDARTAAERQREAEETERDRAIRDQIEAEKRFSEDLALERERRIEDLNIWAAEKFAAVQESLQDEFDEVEAGQQRIADIESKIQQLRLQQLEQYWQDALVITEKWQPLVLNASADPLVPGGASFPGSSLTNPGAGGGTGGNTTGNGQVGTLGQLQQLAENMANYYDLLTDTLQDYIDSATIKQLQDLIKDLQDGTIDDDSIPRRFGGSILGGKKYTVGEVGPEVLRSESGGMGLVGLNGPQIIQPEPGFRGVVEPLVNRSQYPTLTKPSQTITNIDNSRKAEIDFSMLKLDDFSPEQIVIMQQVFSQLFMQALGK